jgi:hypothetical protein
LVTDGPKSNREEEKKMNKQMTQAEIELLQQSRLAPISAKVALVRVESGPCPPPNIPAALALASVTMK